MHYSFDAYPLVYVAAALAIFGLPMACIFLAAMKGMGGGIKHSPNRPATTLPSSVAQTPVIVKSPLVTPHTAAALSKTPKPTRKRALEVKISWVSLPTTPNQP